MIELERVTKRYVGGIVAVDDVSLEVPAGSVMVLVGSSGSGKTTVLRMINRMVEPTAGNVRIAGRDVRDIPAHDLRRSIGYVIQQVGLFPHRTVRDNIMTVPRLLGWDRRRARARADELLELVGLEVGLGDRYPSQLSGGQQQRVGVARALAADPPVLLLDEPFGAVDPVVRAQLQADLLRLQRELHKTVVFVTHDVHEAVLLGDRIAVFAPGGRLQQVDTPARLLRSPVNDFVAEFLGGERRLTLLELVPAATLPRRGRDELPEGLDSATLPRVRCDATARVVLDAALGSPSGAVVLVGVEGEPLGVVLLQDLAGAEWMG